MSKAIQIKVVEALDKIGKSNGTALPLADPPSDLKTNEEINAFHDERAASFELLIAQQISSYAEKRVDKAKDNVRKQFSEIIDAIKPGSSNTIVRGNTALNVEVRNPPARLDKALLTTAMAKRGINMTDIEAILSEGSASSKAPTYFKPSIVA
jgi:prephenate dehydratase